MNRVPSLNADGSPRIRYGVTPTAADRLDSILAQLKAATDTTAAELGHRHPVVVRYQALIEEARNA